MNTRKNLLIVVGEWWEARRAESSTVTPGGKPGRMPRLVKWLLPNGGTLLLITLLIATQSVWARNLQSPAAPGPSATTVNYQGRLADSGGTPINGNRAMTFAVYDAATSGTLIWGPETHAAIPVSNGLFSVGLGSQTSGGIPTTAWNGDRYLEISVGGETLSPRELIRSVPIAGMALTVPDGAISTSQIANGTVTGLKIAADAIGSDQIAASAVGSGEIANGSVTSPKVAITHGFVAPNAGVTNLTTAWQVVPGTSFTVNPTTAQVAQIHVTIDASPGSNNGCAIGQVWVDNVMTGRPAALCSSATIRGTVSTNVEVTLSPGNHSIDLRVINADTGTGYVRHENTVMTYVLFSQ